MSRSAMAPATALASRFRIETHDAAPADAGVPDAERHHPALVVRGIRIELGDIEAHVLERHERALTGVLADRCRLGRVAPVRT